MIVFSVQWSAVRVTAVIVTDGYSDSLGNPCFIQYYREGHQVSDWVGLT